MNAFERIAYLVATDAAFRQALEADPQAAIATRGLTLSAEEMAVVSNLRHLLTIPPQVLAARLLSLNGPAYWGGVPPLLANS